MSLICLFFPAFISTRQVLKENENLYKIIETYSIYNVLINFMTLLVIRILRNAEYLINSGSFTVKFSVNYLLVSLSFAFILPKLIKYAQKNIKFSIRRK